MVYLINLYKELKKSRGNVLKYALHSTVLLFNVQNQTCEAGGVWSGGGPIACTFVDCGDVPGLLNGAVHVLDGRTTYGARIKVCVDLKKTYLCMYTKETVREKIKI